MRQKAVSDSLRALPAGTVALITLLSVRCYKHLGVNICRDCDRPSYDSTDAVGPLK